MKEENYTRRYVKDYTWQKFLFQIWAAYCVCAPVFWFFYKYEIKGRENIPKGKRFICAANHISYFDPFLVFLAVNKPISFMAKKELFESKRLAKTIDFLGAFAVNREKLEVSTIKTVKEIFKTKHWYFGIFPEGGIRKNKKIEKINKGFAAIAKAAKADVLPISIKGVEQYNWIPFKGKIVVEVGKPISYNQEINEIIDEWGQKVSKMANYEYINQEETEVPQKEIAQCAR